MVLDGTHDRKDYFKDCIVTSSCWSSYEFQRFTAKIINTKIGKILAYPGLMLQKLTTKEPDDEQLKIALVSLNYALDENFEGEIVLDLATNTITPVTAIPGTTLTK